MPACYSPTRTGPRTFASVTRVTLRLALAVAAATLYGGMANAYDQYSVNRDATNCRGCHGNFRATAPYTSANDGVAWKDPSSSASLNLHDGHRSYMLNGDCDVCHSAAGRFPVYTNSSVGGIGLDPISCLGCHGRAEPNAGGAVTGAGLRQHHYRSGETVCATSGCHSDANPANFTTAPEKVFPPYYATPDADHPNKPANPCNIGGSESAVAPPLGLDNDGDLVYDGAEAECDVTPTRSSTWGRVKITYH